MFCVVEFRPLLKTVKMCFSCSRLVIPNSELLEKIKNEKNFTESSKYIYASLPPIKIDQFFKIDQARELLNASEKNYIDFLKLHYLNTNEDSYRPYKIDSIDAFKYADDSDDEENRMTNLSFLAQYQLRYVTMHLVYILERIAEKKRRRRLQYRCNKKEQRNKEW